MTTLKDAQKQGKIDQFIQEREKETVPSLTKPKNSVMLQKEINRNEKRFIEKMRKGAATAKRIAHHPTREIQIRRVSDLIPFKSETGHSTQKPVECMRRPIINNSVKGDQVYDPFLGSGTTVIAAQMEERQCFGMELSPAYVDIVVQRWQKFTGKEARLQSTDQTFAEVSKERG